MVLGYRKEEQLPQEWELLPPLQTTSNVCSKGHTEKAMSSWTQSTSQGASRRSEERLFTRRPIGELPITETGQLACTTAQGPTPPCPSGDRENVDAIRSFLRQRNDLAPRRQLLNELFENFWRKRERHPGRVVRFPISTRELTEMYRNLRANV